MNTSAATTLFNAESSVPLTHSVPVVACLFAFTIVYADLGFLLSALSNAAGLVIWLGIVVFRSPQGDTTS